MAMDIFGPLPKTQSGNRFILVCIDHFSRWVELTALSRIREQDVAEVLRDRWIPNHGVPRVILSDNGRQFVSEVIRNLCESIGARKIYSSLYHPQGNSMCETFMRTLKKALGALVSEDGRDWDVHVQAVAFAHNSTPHTSTKYSPFYLLHGREAVLPIQRHLDMPVLDTTSRKWLDRLWKARMDVYRVHLEMTKKRREILDSPGVRLPNETIVAVKLTPTDLQGLSSKLAPKYAGPWVVVECFENGTTYKVRCPITGNVRQVPRNKLKVLDLPEHLGTRPGDELPRWVAPWSGRSIQASREVEEPTGNAFRAYPVNDRNLGTAEGTLSDQRAPEEPTNAPEAHPANARNLGTAEGTLSDQLAPEETAEVISGTLPLREGLRSTISRQARAAPGGVYVRPRRARRRGRRQIQQGADDMVQNG